MIQLLLRDRFSYEVDFTVYILKIKHVLHQQLLIQFQRLGRLAQLVERTLSMREVGGSKPPLSTLFDIFCEVSSNPTHLPTINWNPWSVKEQNKHQIFAKIISLLKTMNTVEVELQLNVAVINFSKESGEVVVVSQTCFETGVCFHLKPASSSNQLP